MRELGWALEQSRLLCSGKAPRAARGTKSFAKALEKGVGHLGRVTKVLLGARGGRKQ